MAQFESWDDYLVPGTDVLRNLAGLTDATELKEFEERVAFYRTGQVRDAISVSSFDYELMKSIHGWIFQDVYGWAGQPRVGPVFPSLMTKVGPDVSGGPGSDPGTRTAGHAYQSNLDLETSTAAVYGMLASKHDLVGLDRATFVIELSNIWSEVNYVHSFREGNTRSQLVFFELLSENAGFALDTEALDVGMPLREEFVRARFYALLRDSTWLAQVLDAVIRAPGDGAPDLSLGEGDNRRPQLRLKDIGVPTNRGRFTGRRRPDSQNGLS